MEQNLEILNVGDVYKWLLKPNIEIVSLENHFSTSDGKYIPLINLNFDPFIVTSATKKKKYWVFQCYYIETNSIFYFRLRSYGKSIDEVLLPRYINNILEKVL